RGDFVFFWSGWPSQWFDASFTIDGIEYTCAEQYMMAEKARLFEDEETCRMILASTSPREHKVLGRRVRGYAEAGWQAVCREVVYRGNLAKFSQSPHLYDLLMETGEKTLAEASPTDVIWGIGLATDDPRAVDRAAWRGTNWLGEALMRVRAELR